jgi:nucleoside-diphosphate-sugar epimerase
MNKLIVGCGYLGSRVAPLWRAQGHRVFAVTRTKDRVEELARLGAEAVVGDVLDPASLRRLPEVDGVLWCVGLDRTAGSTMREVYVQGLGNVLDALPGAPRFVYVSSTGVYAQGEGEEIDEEAAVGPVEESGWVVLEAERLLRRRRPDAVVLRFAGIYGPGRLPRAAALLQGTPLATDPDGWLNLIHVADGARAVLAAFERGAPGAVYNVSDGSPVRRREFYARLAEVLAAAPPRFAPPGREPGRRIRSEKLLRLGVAPGYPSYVEGLEASL